MTNSRYIAQGICSRHTARLFRELSFKTRYFDRTKVRQPQHNTIGKDGEFEILAGLRAQCFENFCRDNDLTICRNFDVQFLNIHGHAFNCKLEGLDPNDRVSDDAYPDCITVMRS